MILEYHLLYVENIMFYVLIRELKRTVRDYV